MAQIIQWLKDAADALTSIQILWVFFVGLIVAAYNIGVHVERRRHQGTEHLRKRFELIYAPLNALFIDRHITTAKYAMAAYFSQRRGNAWTKLKKFKFRAAWTALFDRQESEGSAEVEFGKGFPFDEIMGIVKKNEAYADKDLIVLVSHVDRSHYEDYDADTLTPQELALAEYIWKTHEKLDTRLNPM